MSQDFLNFTVGSSKRLVTVEDIKVDEVKIKDSKLKKLFFYTRALDNNKEFIISDAWICDDKNTKKVQGLWFSLASDNQFLPNSSVAKLIKYYSVNTLKELIGQKVEVLPDERGYLCIVACDIDEAKQEEPSKKTSLFE